MYKTPASHQKTKQEQMLTSCNTENLLAKTPVNMTIRGEEYKKQNVLFLLKCNFAFHTNRMYHSDQTSVFHHLQNNPQSMIVCCDNTEEKKIKLFFRIKKYHKKCK